MLRGQHVIVVFGESVNHDDRSGAIDMLTSWGTIPFEPLGQALPGESAIELVRPLGRAPWVFVLSSGSPNQVPQPLALEASAARSRGAKTFLLGLSASTSSVPATLQEFPLTPLWRDTDGRYSTEQRFQTQLLLALDRARTERGDSYFSRYRLAAWRCFKKPQELRLSRGWNVILGDNGTGKTTFLRDLAADEPVGTAEMSDASTQRPLCFGYGAGRGTRIIQVSRADQHPCATLLDDSAVLPDPEEWLLQTELAAQRDAKARERVERIKTLLTNGVLPDVSTIDFAIAGTVTEVVCDTPYGRVPMRDLSFGYRAALSWILDLGRRLFERYPASENPFAEPAVCLVDEIDLHLHPKWQRSLIEHLTKQFPKTQFIVTAHSPLIVQAAPPGANLALFRREGDQVIIENDVDHIRDWRIDQILSSELFEQQSIYPRETQQLLDERYALLGKPGFGPADQQRVDEIDAQLERLPSAARPEDQRALDLIRETAASLAIR